MRYLACIAVKGTGHRVTEIVTIEAKNQYYLIDEMKSRFSTESENLGYTTYVDYIEVLESGDNYVNP